MKAVGVGASIGPPNPGNSPSAPPQSDQTQGEIEDERYAHYGQAVTHPVIGSGQASVGQPPDRNSELEAGSAYNSQGRAAAPSVAIQPAADYAQTKGGYYEGGGGQTGGRAPSSGEIAAYQRTGGAIDEEAGNAYSALTSGFSDVFTASFKAGARIGNTPLGGELRSSVGVRGPAPTDISSSSAFGIKAVNARAFSAGTAAYLFPGGAIVHGLSDTKEGAASRFFDVGVGLLPFAPEAEGVGAAFASGARGLALRAGAGAGISAGLTALQGGTPMQIGEAAAVGSIIGVGTPYALKGLRGIAGKIGYTGEDRVLVRLTSSPEESVVTPARTPTLETTESGGTVHGSERTTRIDSSPQGLGGSGSEYGDIISAAKSTPKGTFAASEDIGHQLAQQTVTETSSKFVSEEASIGPNAAARAGRGADVTDVFNRSTGRQENIPETAAGEGSNGTVIRSPYTPVSDAAFERARVSRFFRSGVATTGDFEPAQAGGGGSPIKPFETPEGSYRDGEAMFRNRGPGAQSGGVDEGRGGSVSRLYEKPGERTAFNVGREHTVLTLRETGEASASPLTAPPGFSRSSKGTSPSHGSRGKTGPDTGQPDITKPKIGSKPTGGSRGRTWPGTVVLFQHPPHTGHPTWPNTTTPTTTFLTTPGQTTQPGNPPGPALQGPGTQSLFVPSPQKQKGTPFNPHVWDFLQGPAQRRTKPRGKAGYGYRELEHFVSSDLGGIFGKKRGKK